jgi:serine/threonine protein kinase
MLQIHISNKREQQQQQLLEHPSGPIEFGRGPRRENGPPRCVIQDDLYLSKDHLRVEEISGSQIRITNLSQRNPVWLSDNSTVAPGLERELPLPVRLTVGETVIAIDAARTGGVDSKHLVPAPLEDTSGPMVPDLFPGERVGEYTILEFIGRGGMAQVYKAQHRSMKRTVAIKVLPRKYSVATMRELFEREMEVAGRLSHPNILRAYDAGEHEGKVYLVTEFVNGTDLYNLVRQQGPVLPVVAIDYIIQAAQGLGHAHDRGVVHRDVKPSNLILNEAGKVQVLDFGLACFRSGLLEPKNYCLESDPLPEVSVLYGEPDMDSLASIFNLPTYDPDARLRDPEATLLQGLLVGTPAYMSPEQTYSNEVDRRSDIYGLGCSFFFLLSAKPLYHEATIPQVLGAHRAKPIPSLPEIIANIPANIYGVFQKMVAKRPEDRFQSMAEVIVEMEVALADLADRPLLFVCYRREDSFDATHRLYERLATRFGEKTVVMDIDTIPPGEDFRAFLEKAVNRCGVMLVVIGDHWLKIRNEKGQRRLDHRMDYVRFEIATALDLKKPVIPILVGRASMPAAEDLPRELKDLAFLQAAELRSAGSYEDHVDRLVKRLQEVLGARN